MVDIVEAPSATRRSFWRLWWSALVSGIGDGIRIGALPLLAAALTREPVAVAVVTLAGGLPWLVAGPFTGALTDRWPDRRRVLWLTDVVSAVAVGVFAVSVAAGAASIALLAVVNFLLGTVQTLRDNAALAIVPDLVDREKLETANSRVQAAQLITMELIGPPLGAVLFSLPAGTPFFADSVSFVVSAVAVFGIAAVARKKVAPAPRTNMLADIGHGLSWLWRNRLLRSLCLLAGLTNLAVMTVLSIAVLYAYEVLHVGHLAYGLLLGVVALGGLAGTLGAPALAARVGRGRSLQLSFALAPVAFVVAGTTSDALVAAIALTAVGAAVGITNVLGVSLRQLLVPEHLVGRVNASYRFFAVGMGPLGAVLGGVLAQWLGLRAPFLAGAVVLLIGWLLAMNSMRERDIRARLAGEEVPPRRRRKLRTAAYVALGTVIALVVGAGGYGMWLVRDSFPDTAGEVQLSGLHGQVRILRDGNGIPQIYASDAHDLFLAQGYVHAQDRFWEMDVRRHIAGGRLSEMFGKSQIETDKVVRTMGWYRVAQQEIGLLSPATRGYLQAYSDGVNAYLGGHQGGSLGVEYPILGLATPDYAPQPWTPADSVSWFKAMAWSLNYGVDDETQRALLASALPAAQVDQLYPPYDYARFPAVVPSSANPVSTTPAGGGSTAGLPAGLAKLRSTLSAVLGPSGEGIGSNAWVVAGSRTTTGLPILANDPHLPQSAPGVWYQAGLHCVTVTASCPFDVTGFTFSGVPGVLAGHNRDIAWGFTNLGADDSDLFLEQVTGGTYLNQGRQLPVETRQEVIEVGGGEPVTFTVRSTVHGPLLSDALADTASAGTRGRSPGAGPGPYQVALRWSALDPGRTMDAVFQLDAAADWTQFRAALAQFTAPSLNLLYADRAGNIGYQMTGRMPVRAGGDGSYPSPGWTGTHDWTGFLAFDQLPRVLNPPQGYIVSANNAVAGPGYPYFLGRYWEPGYRAQRITDLVTRPGKLDVAAMQKIQLDTFNTNAPDLVPYLLRVDAGPARQAQDLLRGWDFSQPAGSAPAAYFNAVWRNLLRLTFTDDLAKTPAKATQSGGGRWFDIVRRMLAKPDDPLWRNATDPRHLSTRDDVLRAALQDADRELRGKLGDDPASWRWGDLHQVTFKNQTLGTGGPAPVQWLLNEGPYPTGGSSEAVDATSWDAGTGYDVTMAPSMRMVVDLADLDGSRWINQSGASGHATAETYADQTALWLRGESLAWPFSAAAVEANTQQKLELRP
ncbi:MFS transporter [Amycolatopsis sp. lyj-23]|uniref:MFS transporter n=1 Tax=Amycolatopsis sp. lyj-23 TaxID=2789283 RepID=UPI00397DD9FF